jgi:hypothetical protein
LDDPIAEHGGKALAGVAVLIRITNKPFGKIMAISNNKRLAPEPPVKK